MQSYHSVMYGFYCIASIEYKILGKALLDDTDLFWSKDYQSYSKIIYMYFKDKNDKKLCSLTLDWKIKWNKKIMI